MRRKHWAWAHHQMCRGMGATFEAAYSVVHATTWIVALDAMADTAHLAEWGVMDAATVVTEAHHA